MSDVESVSTISAVDSVMPSAKRAANGGKRWTPEQMEKLWAHRHFGREPSWCMKCDCDFCENLRRTGKMPKKNPPYKEFGEKHRKTAQACRLKIHHVKKDVRTGAISLEDALDAKPLPSQRALAKRKQAAAKKRACSPKDALAGKPIPDPTSKPQKQAAAEKKVRSPKCAFAGKPLPAFTPMPRKQVSAEKRALSPEDTVDEKPLPSQTCKLQEQIATEKRSSSPEDALAKALRSCQLSKSRSQAAAERNASSPEATRADGLQSGQTSKSQDHGPAESGAGSPADALSEEPRSCPVSRPQQHVSVEDPSCFRSNDGARVAHLSAAITLASMRTQAPVQNRSVSSEKNFFDWYVKK